jgi:hypothetical protein
MNRGCAGSGSILVRSVLMHRSTLRSVTIKSSRWKEGGTKETLADDGYRRITAVSFFRVLSRQIDCNNSAPFSVPNPAIVVKARAILHGETQNSLQLSARSASPRDHPAEDRATAWSGRRSSCQGGEDGVMPGIRNSVRLQCTDADQLADLGGTLVAQQVASSFRIPDMTPLTVPNVRPHALISSRVTRRRSTTS